jgi:septum formation protein
LFKTKRHIILASNSPRRKEFLFSLGIEFDIIPADVDEKLLPGETFREHVIRLSVEKSKKVSKENPDAFVLGADTLVVIDKKPLGKPKDEGEAVEMLRTISGKTHTVLSGYCVVDGGTGDMRTGVVETDVTIKELTEGEIEAYVSTRESMDKAGSYAIQGIGSFMVSEISGSYTNVVGLPVPEVVGAFLDLGAIEIVKSEESEANLA